MTEDIPKEIIEKIKKERKEDYYEGYEAGIEFAKESDYSTIDKVVDTIDRNDIKKLMKLLGDSDQYFDSSSKFKEGFKDALAEVLEKSAKD